MYCWLAISFGRKNYDAHPITKLVITWEVVDVWQPNFLNSRPYEYKNKVNQNQCSILKLQDSLENVRDAHSHYSIQQNVNVGRVIIRITTSTTDQMKTISCEFQ